MKAIVSLFIVGCLTAGCIGPGAITHEDSPAAYNRDAGPALCRDGTTPPCNDRDD
jgi:hypothetical protein